MSQWTHVAGCFRVDCMRHFPTARGARAQLEGIIKTNLPHGGEGPLRVLIEENPMMEAVAAFAVMVYGDLRDFGTERLGEIETWLEGIGEKLSPKRDDMGPRSFPGFIRNAVLEVDVEFAENRVYRFDTEVGKWSIVRWSEISAAGEPPGEVVDSAPLVPPSGA